MKAILFIFLLFIFSGCISNPQKYSAVPTDFEAIYSYGACHAEWGRTNIFIDANGSGIYESGSGIYENEKFTNQEFRKAFSLNETELLELITSIEQTSFYSLNDYYSNPDIVDGSCSFISVTKNNVTKSVSVSNMKSPSAYSNTADLIFSIAENKTK